MRTFGKKSGDNTCLTYSGKPVGELPTEVVDEILSIEEQNQNMAMLLRMLVHGRDVKEKARLYLNKSGLNNPLR